MTNALGKTATSGYSALHGNLASYSSPGGLQAQTRTPATRRRTCSPPQARPRSAVVGVPVEAWIAADVLARTGDKAAAAALSAALPKQRNWRAKRSIAEALAAIGSPASGDVLDSAAAAERNPAKRRRLRRLAKKARAPS